MRHDRRSFLKRSALAGGSLVGLNFLLPRRAGATVPAPAARSRDSGLSSAKPSENTGEVLLALPEEFKYNILIRSGVTMGDGRVRAQRRRNGCLRLG